MTQRVEPYAIANVVRLNGHSDPKSTSGNSSVQTESGMKASMGRLSISQNSETVVKETKSTECRATFICFAFCVLEMGKIEVLIFAFTSLEMKLLKLHLVLLKELD